MAVNIIIVYNDKDQLSDLKIDESFDVEFIDSKYRIDKKKAWKIKNFYGAKLDPFAVILDNNKTIRAFYSEAENVINSLNKYLKNYGKDSDCNKERAYRCN